MQENTSMDTGSDVHDQSKNEAAASSSTGNNGDSNQGSNEQNLSTTPSVVGILNQGTMHVTYNQCTSSTSGHLDKSSVASTDAGTHKLRSNRNWQCFKTSENSAIPVDQAQPTNKENTTPTKRKIHDENPTTGTKSSQPPTKRVCDHVLSDNIEAPTDGSDKKTQQSTKNSNLPSAKAGRDQKLKHKQSSSEELTNYSKKKFSTNRYRYCNTDPKLHVIMNYAEMFAYKKDFKAARTWMNKFYKEVKNQSTMSANDLENLIENIPDKKNPVRATLFYAAAACKYMKDCSSFKHKLDYLGKRIFEIYMLVKNVTSHKDKKNLDFKLFKNGAGPVEISTFMVSIMHDLYKRVCASDTDGGANTNKAYCLMWIAIGFDKANEQTKAIKLLTEKRSHYDGIKNWTTFGIFKTLGLCLEKKNKFEEALKELEQAKLLASDQDVTWKNIDTDLEFLNKAIERVKQNIPSTGRKQNT